MPLNYFAPKPGRFGVASVLLNSGQIGGADYLGGATPLTANASTTFRLGGTAGRKCRISRFGATVTTMPADADGTITAVLQKYDASANAAVALTGAINLEALVTREETSVVFLATLTDAQATLDTGDALEVVVTNNSAAIDTQPAGLVFTVELLVQE
jgi:hypothetical protein